MGADATADGIDVAHAGRVDHARVRSSTPPGLYADEVSAMLGGKTFQIYPVPRRVRRTGAGQARPRQRTRLSAAPHARTGRARHQDVAGNVTFGPTAKYQDRKDDYERRPDSARETFSNPPGNCCRKSRSRISGSAAAEFGRSSTLLTSSFSDFMIERDEVNPRLIQAAGIESPGLTSCLSIAEQVAELVEETL